MKYHLLLPPVVLALCGCHTDLYYQEQAVESARKFIYKHARELSAEQFAYVPRFADRTCSFQKRRK